MNRNPFICACISVVCFLLTAILRAEQFENEVVLSLEPSHENPRSSEGAFVTLTSGRILFFYTRFQGGDRDESPAQIVSLLSEDNGRTWSHEPNLVVGKEGGANVMSVSLLRLRSGRIALFYLVKNDLLDCRPVMRISDDEAKHWSEPQFVTRAPGYFVLNNDRVIQTSAGHLILPLAFHRSRGSDPKDSPSWDSRGIVLWYLSDDEGKTWREAHDWWALPLRSRSGYQEPGVVELADGKLLSWMRTDQGAQFGSYSADGGNSWLLPEKTTLESPLSPASIKRLPNSPDLLAIFNDHSGKFDFPRGKRSPLVAAISHDGGKTWPARRIIESDRDGSYCYTAIHFIRDGILLAYCAGDSKVGNLNRLRLRRISAAWLKEI